MHHFQLVALQRLQCGDVPGGNWIKPAFENGLVPRLVEQHVRDPLRAPGVGDGCGSPIRVRRSFVSVKLLRGVKRTLDPQGIMNPGVLVPDRT